MRDSRLFRILLVAAPAIASVIIYREAVLARGDEAAKKQAPPKAAPVTAKGKGTSMDDQVVKTEQEWRAILTPEQFAVLRKKGTERAFSGRLWDNHETGVYVCAACANPLFGSDTKFESGTGWPSFWAPLTEKSVRTQEDNSLFSRRTEVLCRRCGGHIGHVFDDGPKPTGQRYCMNSVSMNFVKGQAAGAR
jgi:peptide-methionine (R)-S-oxide reductase